MFSLINLGCAASCGRPAKIHPIPIVLDAAIGVALFLIAYQVIKVSPSILPSNHILPLAGFSCAPLIVMITSIFGRCVNKSCGARHHGGHPPLRSNSRPIRN